MSKKRRLSIKLTIFSCSVLDIEIDLEPIIVGRR